MIWFLIGVGLLAACLVAMRGVGSFHPRRLVEVLRLASVAGLGVLCLYSLVRGQPLNALLFGSLAVGVYDGTLLGQRSRVFRRRGREEGAPPPGARAGRMSREEAMEVLGLSGTPDEAAIQEAYLRLIKQVHPDRGGTDYLAAKLNEAREVLLGR